MTPLKKSYNKSAIYPLRKYYDNADFDVKVLEGKHIKLLEHNVGYNRTFQHARKLPAINKERTSTTESIDRCSRAVNRRPSNLSTCFLGSYRSHVFDDNTPSRAVPQHMDRPLPPVLAKGNTQLKPIRRSNSVMHPAHTFRLDGQSVGIPVYTESHSTYTWRPRVSKQRPLSPVTPPPHPPQTPTKTRTGTPNGRTQWGNGLSSCLINREERKSAAGIDMDKLPFLPILPPREHHPARNRNRREREKKMRSKPARDIAPSLSSHGAKLLRSQEASLRKRF